MIEFLSTLSLRRATVRTGYAYTKLIISIHALLAESDRLLLYPFSACHSHFYPRSPCGERPPRGDSCYLDNIISIHALLAESDPQQSVQDNSLIISIHALLAESDHRD